MSARLKKILKISSLTIIIVIAFVVAAMYVLFSLKKEWILSRVENSINTNLTGELHIKDIGFSPFSSFPNLGLNLKGVEFYDHQDSLSLKNSENIIFSAKEFIVGVNIMTLLIHSGIEVNKIAIYGSELNLVQLNNGSWNIEKALQKPSIKSKVAKKKKIQKKKETVVAKKKITTSTPEKDEMVIEIDQIYLSEVSVNIQSLSNIYSLKYYILTSNTVINYQESDISGSISTKGKCYEYNTEVPILKDIDDVKLKAAFLYNKKDQILNIDNMNFSIEDFLINASGSYHLRGNKEVDIKFDAESNELLFLNYIFRNNVLDQNKPKNNKGVLYVNGSIKGPSKNKLPLISSEFGLKEMTFTLPESMGTINNFKFNGMFLSGTKRDLSDARFRVDTMVAELPGGYINGNFKLENFKDPHISYLINASVNISNYEQIFNIDHIDELSGNLKLDAKYQGKLSEATESPDSLAKGNIKLAINSIEFNLPNIKSKKVKINGTVKEFNDVVYLEKIDLEYGQSSVSINGRFNNTFQWLFTKELNLPGEINLAEGIVNSDDFLLDPGSSPRVEGSFEMLSSKVKFTLVKNPKSLELAHIKYSVDTLNTVFTGYSSIDQISAKGKINFLNPDISIDIDDLECMIGDGHATALGELTIENANVVRYQGNITAKNLNWNEAKMLFTDLKSDHKMVSLKTEPEAKKRLSFNIHIDCSLNALPFRINKTVVKNSSFTIGGDSIPNLEFYNMNGSVDSIVFLYSGPENSMSGLSNTSFEFDLERISIPTIHSFRTKLKGSGINNTIAFNFSTKDAPTDLTDGSLKIDFSSDTITTNFMYHVQEINLEKILRNYDNHTIADGLVDIYMDFEFKGGVSDSTFLASKGEITIEGEDLQLHGIDLDEFLRKYRKSQKFNLVDVSAFILAGPAGALVTKGTNFAALLNIRMDSSDRSNIANVIANWKLDEGILYATDVAFSTTQNRVAFLGMFDLIQENIPGFTVAVIDKNGCALMEQKIYGDFDDVQVGRLRIAKTLLGAFINAANSVVGKDCDVIYSGKINPPIEDD